MKKENNFLTIPEKLRPYMNNKERIEPTKDHKKAINLTYFK
jgi:hypothetical protein